MRRPLLLPAAVLFAVAFGLTAAVQVQFPLSFGDYAGNWGLKARTLHASGVWSRVFSLDPAGEFSHPEYPLAWPLLLAGISSALGRYDEYLLAFVRPLLTLAVAALAARRTDAPPAMRLVAAAAICLLPYFQNPVFAGYAEALLLVFLLAGLSLLETPDASLVGQAGGALCLALAASTKNEGALAALVVAGALAWTGRKRAALLSAAATLAATGAWALFRSGHLSLRPLADFSAGAFSVGKLAVAGREILGGQLLPVLPWGLGVAALFVISPGAATRRRVPLVASGLYTLLLFGSYAFTRLEPAWHVQNSWSRLVLVPLVAVLVPTVVEAFWEGGQPAASPEALQPEGTEPSPASPASSAR